MDQPHGLYVTGRLVTIAPAAYGPFWEAHIDIGADHRVIVNCRDRAAALGAIGDAEFGDLLTVRLYPFLTATGLRLFPLEANR